MFPEARARNNKVSDKARSEAGRKGRKASGCDTPVHLNGSKRHGPIPTYKAWGKR